MAQRNFIEERRGKVLEYININSRADIPELANLLECTEATIRRDLDFLEGQDLVIRTHGGAIKKEKARSVWQTTPVSDRMEQNSPEKKLIAAAAASGAAAADDYTDAELEDRDHPDAGDLRLPARGRRR